MGQSQPCVSIIRSSAAWTYMPSLSRSSGTLNFSMSFCTRSGCTSARLVWLHVVHGESLEEGNDIHAFLLLLAHGTVYSSELTLWPLLVLDQHIPIDHGEGFFTFQYMGLEVVRLLEGEVHRQAVAHGLRSAAGGRRNWNPNSCGHPRSAGVRQIRMRRQSSPVFQSEAFICSIRAIIISAKRSMAACPALPGCVSSRRHSFRHPLPDGPSGRCPSVQHRTLRIHPKGPCRVVWHHSR